MLKSTIIAIAMCNRAGFKENSNDFIRDVKILSTRRRRRPPELSCSAKKNIVLKTKKIDQKTKRRKKNDVTQKGA